MSAIVSTEYKMGIKKMKMERGENRNVNLQIVVFIMLPIASMSESKLKD